MIFGWNQTVAEVNKKWEEVMFSFIKKTGTQIEKEELQANTVSFSNYSVPAN